MRLDHEFMYVLEATGRPLRIGEGILGIDVDGNSARLCCGYDDYVGEFEEPLTPEERREIAEHMIARWKQWAGLTEEHP